MEIQGDKLMVYSRGRLVYVADLGQIMLAKLTPGRGENHDIRGNYTGAAAMHQKGLPWQYSHPLDADAGSTGGRRQGMKVYIAGKIAGDPDYREKWQ